MKTIEVDGDYLMITPYYKLIEKGFLDVNLEIYTTTYPDIPPKDIEVYKLEKVDEISKIENAVNHDDYLIIAPATDFGSHRRLSRRGDFFEKDLEAFLRNHPAVLKESVTIFRLENISLG
jgi:hypothetical protein